MLLDLGFIKDTPIVLDIYLKTMITYLLIIVNSYFIMKMKIMTKFFISERCRLALDNKLHLVYRGMVGHSPSYITDRTITWDAGLFQQSRT